MTLVKNPAGTTVLTLGDSAVVGGYLVTAYSEGGRTWRRHELEPARVDGTFEFASPVLAGRELTLAVYIEGTNWAQVTARHTALLDAVEVSGWQLTIEGVTWVCRVADSESPMPPLGSASDWREVTLTFPVTQRRGI